MAFKYSTLTTQAQTALRDYVIDNIDLTEHLDSPIDHNDTIEVLYNLHKVFNDEYAHKINSIGFERALTDWISGSPSCLTIDFYNSGVYSACVSLDIFDKDSSEDTIEDCMNEWFTLLAHALMALWLTPTEIETL